MLGLATFLMIPAAILGLISGVMSIWLLVMAFRKSVLWGVASLFVPFAIIVFAIQNWGESRKPFLIGIGSGVASMVLAFLALGMGAVSLGQRMEAELAAQAQAAAESADEVDESPVAEEAEPPSRGPSEASPSPMAILEGFDPGPEADSSSAPASEKLFYDPATITSDGFAPIALGQAPKAVGRPVRVVGRDGRRHYGELVAANTGGVKLQRWISGSEVIYEMRAGEIDQVLVDVRP